MTVSAQQSREVRARARAACEYCGITETDLGGGLTIDHYQPQSCGGSDELDNLVYCCHTCNGFKADTWHAKADHARILNPRVDIAAQHLLALPDGTLQPLSPIGTWTIDKLRLNRHQLVAHRLHEASHNKVMEALKLLRDLRREQISRQMELPSSSQLLRELLDEQNALLDSC